MCGEREAIFRLGHYGAGGAVAMLPDGRFDDTPKTSSAPLVFTGQEL
ncbi:MAG: hypothetical protein ACO3JL_13425 [Myxococcota bacterium]